MIIRLFGLLPLVLVFSACNEKEQETDKKFISVRSLIEQQVAHVDTSLYAITKVVQKDTLPGDTFYIKREDFRAEAAEFLSIPDLSEKKIARGYNEETRFDELLNRVMITYTPKNPQKEVIQKQEILVTPNIATGDKVNNIIIESVKSDRNGFLGKKMLWQLDKSFLITTTTQQPGEPEVVTTVKVTWNDHNNE